MADSSNVATTGPSTLWSGWKKSEGWVRGGLMESWETPRARFR